MWTGCKPPVAVCHRLRNYILGYGFWRRSQIRRRFRKTGVKVRTSSKIRILRRIRYVVSAERRPATRKQGNAAATGKRSRYVERPFLYSAKLCPPRRDRGYSAWALLSTNFLRRILKRSCSSVGQSAGLSGRMSRVRVPSASPFFYSTL